MPLFPPRENAEKKREQAEKRYRTFLRCVREGDTEHRIAKEAERFKTAKIAYLKAKLHWIHEDRLRGRHVEAELRTILADFDHWQSRLIADIVSAARHELGS